jgi:hypothetical protein
MKPTLVVALAAALACGACRRRDHQDPPPPAPLAVAPEPLRGAAGDSDLRLMLAELASAKACEMIRGQFRGLRAVERPNVVTGVLWIERCKITNEGTKVTFHLGGRGWQWADKAKKKAGGTFVIRQYVRFAVETAIPGALDIAYDRKSHVVSLWFSPSDVQVKFTPLGDFDVDEQGVWSSIIGALGSAFASSPEEQANQQARKEGTQNFKQQMADGLSVTINLCSGLSRFNLGRPPKGQMTEPDVGETRKLPVELQEGGFMAFGPQIVGEGLSIRVDAAGGVRLAVACKAQAEAAAAAFVERQQPPGAGEWLATAEIKNGTGELRIPRTSCLVYVLAWPDGGPVSFDFRRPPHEIARATGGPLIECEKASK